MLSEEYIARTGFFDYDKVKVLVDKLKEGTKVSEIDNMAITGIISTQLLYSFFLEKSLTPTVENEAVILDKIVIENQ